MQKIIFIIVLLAALFTSAALVIAVRADQVTLAWEHPGADEFRIFQRIEGQEYDYSIPAWRGSSLRCTITNLVPGQKYYFVARAYQGAKESADSNEVSYRAVGSVPAVPAGIKLSKQGDGKMNLISDPQPIDQVDYFEVELDGEIVRSDAQRSGDQARLHHDLTGISMGNHTVRIRAINQWGASDWSDPFGFTAALPLKPSGVGLSAD